MWKGIEKGKVGTKLETVDKARKILMETWYSFTLK